MEEIIVTNKKRLFLELLGYIAILVIIIYATRWNAVLCDTTSNYHVFSKLIYCEIFELIFIIIFSGVIFCTIYFLIKPPRVIVVINEKGLGIPNCGFFPWNELCNLKLKKHAGTNYITFNIKQTYSKPGILIFENPYIISCFYSGIKPKKLYKKILKYYEQQKNC